MIAPTPILAVPAAQAERAALLSDPTVVPLGNHPAAKDRDAVFARVTELLAPLGYVAEKRNDCSNGRTIWINAERQLLVKLPYTCDHDRRPTRAVRTETVAHGFVRQPLVDTSPDAVRAALTELEAAMCDNSRDYRVEFGSDARSTNLGLLDGRAVVFDW